MSIVGGGLIGSGGSGGGTTQPPNLFLQNITWNDEKRRAKLEGSFEVLPSSFYMGEFTLSNGVQAVVYRLADGTIAVGMVNRFNPELGSISNPKFFALDKQQTLEVETTASDTISDGFTTSYQINGNNLTFDFYFIPASSGTFRAEYWIGNSTSGNKIFDEQRIVTEAEVLAGQPVSFGVGNPYIIEAGVDLFVRFTGIDFKGNSVTNLPYFVSKILPYKEIGITGHFETITSDLDGLYVGCTYSCDLTNNSITITVKESEGFRDSFRVIDSKGLSDENGNFITVDFSTFNYPAGYVKDGNNVGGTSVGTAQLVNPNDDVEFYWDSDVGVWMYISRRENKKGVV